MGFRGRSGGKIGNGTEQMKNKNIYTQILRHVLSVTDEAFAVLSVSMLAHTFKIDRYKLSRQFKSQAGMTLEYFLFTEKMNRAAFLLKTHGDITVREVAERIGYCTCDHFTRRFREYYGIVPCRYKKYKAGPATVEIDG